MESRKKLLIKNDDNLSTVKKYIDENLNPKIFESKIKKDHFVQVPDGIKCYSDRTKKINQ